MGATTMSFGTFLRHERKQAGYTQRELASLVGVNYSYLAHIEADRHGPPSREVLEKIAGALDVDSDTVHIFALRIPKDLETLLLGVGPNVWTRIRHVAIGGG